ncbi:hypothetical protein BO224_05845 [Erysipelotrichaceae bacterium NYU-BL-E8]|uniref:Uncharacterized protein n=1 Tax=Ileibacterium valens TaxID=1862668 RepID=A0A1U7NDJ7_9FIRM|nr:hypothetical protein BO222_10960 [Ileibacterium valens]OLU40252.1 hypothetical protein BO224_05845 [Erysipelotrichaceae bacterium NYU-BL-E8]OLU41052.1 hypothetical protein BM735_04655 [Erysipelotrichaceae bacterium NYU-BL-F16]
MVWATGVICFLYIMMIACAFVFLIHRQIMFRNKFVYVFLIFLFMYEIYRKTDDLYEMTQNNESKCCD